MIQPQRFAREICTKLNWAEAAEKIAEQNGGSGGKKQLKVSHDMFVVRPINVGRIMIDNETRAKESANCFNLIGCEREDEKRWLWRRL